MGVPSPALSHVTFLLNFFDELRPARRRENRFYSLRFPIDQWREIPCNSLSNLEWVTSGPFLLAST